MAARSIAFVSLLLFASASAAPVALAHAPARPAATLARPPPATTFALPAHSRPATRAIVGGGAALAVGYAFNALIGWGAGWGCASDGGYYALPTFSCSRDDAWSSFREWSLVPVIGPFVQLTLLPDSSGLWVPPLVIMGAVQTAGIAMLIAGLVMKLSPSGAEDDAADASFAVAPTATATDAGLVAFGRF